MPPPLPCAANQLGAVEIGVGWRYLESAYFLREPSDSHHESKVERVGVCSVGGITNVGGQQERRGHERRRLQSTRYTGNAIHVSNAGIEEFI